MSLFKMMVEEICLSYGRVKEEDMIFMEGPVHGSKEMDGRKDLSQSETFH